MCVPILRDHLRHVLRMRQRRRDRHDRAQQDPLHSPCPQVPCMKQHSSPPDEADIGHRMRHRARCVVQRIGRGATARSPAQALEQTLCPICGPLSPSQDAPKRAANDCPANRAAHRSGDRFADVGRDLPGHAVGDAARDLAGDQLACAQTLAAPACRPEDRTQDAPNLADPSSCLRFVSGVIRGGRLDAFFQDFVSRFRNQPRYRICL